MMFCTIKSSQSFCFLQTCFTTSRIVPASWPSVASLSSTSDNDRNCQELTPVILCPFWIPLTCNLNNWGPVNDVLNGIKFLSHCRGRPCFIWSLIEARTSCTTHVVHCWQGTIECHSSPKRHPLFGKATSTSRRWPEYNLNFTLSHGDKCQVAKKYLMVW